jgi:hypothetical protein
VKLFKNQAGKVGWKKTVKGRDPFRKREYLC